MSTKAKSRKVCMECGAPKLLGEFYEHPMMADGYLNRCKICVRARVKEHRLNNLSRIREYDRERDEHPKRLAARKSYREMVNADPCKRKARQAVNQKWVDRNQQTNRIAKQKWGKENRQKRNAHMAVHRAIEAGKLKRLPCEICGAKAQAHHDDYDKPLEIKWLCSLHHGRHHQQLNRTRNI